YCSGELEGTDEVVALDTRAGYYRREVYRGEENVGTIVIGEPPAAVDVDPLVCACHGVTRSAIQACGDLESVRRATGATTGCGGCRGAVASILEQAAEVGFQAVQVEPEQAIEVL